jgi:homocysteine S-methyltransferase
MKSETTLIDGGLSTALESLGNSLHTTLWTGELLRNHSDQIRAAHELYRDAGAKVLTTCSYQVSYPGCIAQGWSTQEVDEALLLSTELARFDGVKVAASVGPYGAYLADGSEYRGNYGLSIDELKDFHRVRLQKLIESKPDLLAIETIPELTEASAILELLTECGNTIPFWISFSCKNEREISSGELFEDAVTLALNSENLLAVGINCTAPELISPLLASAPSAPFIVYPNSGRQWDAVAKQWLGDRELSFTRGQIADWIDAGVIYLGGCCGVAPRDISNLLPLLSA